MSRRAKILIILAMAFAIPSAGSVIAHALVPTDPDRQVTVSVQSNYWGSYKTMDLQVSVGRPHKKPFVVEGFASADRTPPEGLVVDEWTRVGSFYPQSLNNDLWRDDAPLLFKTLDRVCPALNDAC